MLVDDSAVARAVLTRMLADEPDFEIAATACDAASALRILRTTRVDIVLLDVALPGASGLEALPDIMAAGAGARVLIVSSMAEEGAEVTVQALAQGATDAIPKPEAAAFSARFSSRLIDRIRRIGRADRIPEALAGRTATVPAVLRDLPEAPVGCLAIGASTGGLPALLAFLRAMPGRIHAPILVTQHLPPTFMAQFARQLEAASGRKAQVVGEGDRLSADAIHVAPGDAHLTVLRSGLHVDVRLDRRRVQSGCRPSVDPMLTSVAAAYGENALGVILSGMGRDGAIGASRVVEAGGAVIAQDRKTSSVWGMPGSVVQAGLAAAILPPAELAHLVAARAASCR